VVLVLVGRVPDGDRPVATAGEAPTASPNASSPSVAPATIEEFCAAFLVLVDVHGERVADPTPENEERVDEQGRVLLEIGSRLPVPQSIRNGLQGFVQDVMRDPVTASSDEVAEFSAFLSNSCST